MLFESMTNYTRPSNKVHMPVVCYRPLFLWSSSVENVVLASITKYIGVLVSKLITIVCAYNSKFVGMC